MQNKTYTLKLDTDYTTTGNSRGCGLDTLGIAFNYGDSNEMIENNYDYIAEQVDYAKNDWLNYRAELFFTKTLTNEQIEKYANDLPGYHNALSLYRDTFGDVDLSNYDSDDIAQYDLVKTLEKAEASMHDELYGQWLHGDYSEDGLLTKATRHYSDYGITILDGGLGEVEASLDNDTLRIMITDSILDDDATEDEVILWLENDISDMARAVYSKEKARREASKAERERLTEYKAKQKQTADERKKAELLALIK